MPRFADITGQDRAHDQLRASVARDRLPHAYLFHGTPGVGKTSTAFALAQFLNCERPEAADACGSCRTCRNLVALRHPDLHWIFPMAGSDRGVRLKGDKRAAFIQGVIEDRLQPGIRSLSYPGAASIAIGRDEDSRLGSVSELRHQAGYAPVEARVKVFVVSDAERMTREAANSLLKVLEEPPPDNLLVLTTARPGELLDTIVSRCQTVRFRDLSEPEITGLLDDPGVWTRPPRKRKLEKLAVDPRAATLAVALAGGSLTRAATLVQAENVVNLRDEALEFLSLGPGNPHLHQAVAAFDAMTKADKNKADSSADRRIIEQVFDFGLLWLGDLLRVASGSPVPLANRDREAELRRQAGTLSVTDIRRKVAVLETARTALRGNVYRPLVLYPMLYGLDGWTGKADGR